MLDAKHPFLFLRWRIGVHGRVDGYSRVPVYLKASSNNRAATVLESFYEAVGLYGLPSRVRCDKVVKTMMLPGIC